MALSNRGLAHQMQDPVARLERELEELAVRVAALEDYCNSLKVSPWEHLTGDKTKAGQ